MLIGQLAIVVTVVGWLVFVTLTLTRSSITGASGPARARPRHDRLPGDHEPARLLGAGLPDHAPGLLLPDAQPPARDAAPSSASRSSAPPPAMTVLIPSYQEDERVIRMTVLSAALQEYPDLARRPAHRRSAGASVRQARRHARGGQAPARRHRGAPRRADGAVRVRPGRLGRATSRPPASRPSRTSPASRATTSSPRPGWRSTPPTTRSSTTPTASSSSRSCAGWPPT